jgi:hypothetical protein
MLSSFHSEAYYNKWPPDIGGPIIRINLKGNCMETNPFKVGQKVVIIDMPNKEAHTGGGTCLSLFEDDMLRSGKEFNIGDVVTVAQLGGTPGQWWVCFKLKMLDPQDGNKSYAYPVECFGSINSTMKISENKVVKRSGNVKYCIKKLKKELEI